MVRINQEYLFFDGFVIVVVVHLPNMFVARLIFVALTLDSMAFSFGSGLGRVVGSSCEFGWERADMGLVISGFCGREGLVNTSVCGSRNASLVVVKSGVACALCG